MDCFEAIVATDRWQEQSRKAHAVVFISRRGAKGLRPVHLVCDEAEARAVRICRPPRQEAESVRIRNSPNIRVSLEEREATADDQGGEVRHDRISISAATHADRSGPVSENILLELNFQVIGGVLIKRSIDVKDNVGEAI